MSPKKLLRLPEAKSSFDDMLEGNERHMLIFFQKIALPTYMCMYLHTLLIQNNALIPCKKFESTLIEMFQVMTI